MVIYPYWFISCNCSKCATLVPDINDEEKMEERNRKTVFLLNFFSVDMKKKLTFTGPVGVKRYLSQCPTWYLQIHLHSHFAPWFLRHTDDQGA